MLIALEQKWEQKQLLGHENCFPSQLLLICGNLRKKGETNSWKKQEEEQLPHPIPTPAVASTQKKKQELKGPWHAGLESALGRVIMERGQEDGTRAGVGRQHDAEYGPVWGRGNGLGQDAKSIRDAGAQGTANQINR